MSREIHAQSSHAEMSFRGLSTISIDNATCEGQRRFDPIKNSPADTFAYRVIKRSFDIVTVLLIFPFVGLVGCFVALFMILDCPGPLFFSQRRLRRGGEYFFIWKFRTMCCRGPEVLEQHFRMNPKDREEWRLTRKLKEDPRVSVYGAFLRRTSLDELPQIWNVLMGEMSLVGPRPVVFEEIDKYGSDFAYYVSVKPGITGLWQTSGRSSLTYEERVALDRFYVEHWSLWLEFKILLRTIRTVAKSEGAY